MEIESISEINGINLVEENDVNILSVGVSTAGNAEIEMIKKNPKCHIIATTIDENGIKLTEEYIKKQGYEDKIELKLEDISQKLDYADNYFDYVYARLVLHYLDNIKLKNALDEIYRILKPNGKLYVVVRSLNEWEAKLEGSSYDETTGLTKYPDIKTLGTDDVRYIYRRLHSEESIKKFLEEANFNIEYIKTYNEYLCRDYNRQDINPKPSELIEVLAKK